MLSSRKPPSLSRCAPHDEQLTGSGTQPTDPPSPTRARSASGENKKSAFQIAKEKEAADLLAMEAEKRARAAARAEAKKKNASPLQPPPPPPPKSAEKKEKEAAAAAAPAGFFGDKTARAPARAPAPAPRGFFDDKPPAPAAPAPKVEPTRPPERDIKAPAVVIEPRRKIDPPSVSSGSTVHPVYCALTLRWDARSRQYRSLLANGHDTSCVSN